MKIRTGDIDTFFVKHVSDKRGARPLILLHGNGGSHHSFDGVAEELSKRFVCYATDARGQGKTRRGKKPLSYPVLGGDLIAFIEAMNLDHPDVIGYSDGGIVALEAAARSENIGRIVTLGANFSADGLSDEFIEYAKEYLDRSRRFARLPRVRRKRELTRLMTEEDNYDDFAVLKNVRVPVLLLTGDRDDIKREHTEKLAHTIPYARSVVIPDCGHRIIREAPQAFLKEVEAFLT